MSLNCSQFGICRPTSGRSVIVGMDESPFNIRSAAKGGRQKEFDHFSSFSGLFRSLLVTFSDASVTFFVTFSQTPFAGLLLRQVISNCDGCGSAEGGRTLAWPVDGQNRQSPIASVQRTCLQDLAAEKKF